MRNKLANFFFHIARYVSKLSLPYKIGGGILLLSTVIVTVHIFTGNTTSQSTPASISHVQIASVASLSSQGGPLPLTGSVTSLGQATILSQTSGEIVSLPRSLGDHVQAGEVIATFENSSQQAAVVQAQGAYNAALASLANAQGATASNSTITSQGAAQTAQNDAQTVATALQTSYADLDDAVHTKADTLFINAHAVTPTLQPFVIPDSQLVINIQNERSMLGAVLTDAQAAATITATTNLDQNVAQMNADAQTVESFLNNLIAAMNEAVPSAAFSASTLTTDQATLAAARTEVITAMSALIAAKNAYDSAQTGVQTEANSAGSETNNNIALAQANVQEELGALESARVALAKTIVRSPISGVIVSLPITQGDYVASFAEVAEVSNPRALEITTYVTPQDASTLSVGGSALIDSAVKGVITSIAPAIDPSTGQIQVKIGIPGNQNTLTDGDTVSLLLDRATSQAQSTLATTTLVIPIVAAKITPEGPEVFTVSSSTLVAHPITFGPIIGDQVTVTSGLTSTMDIVTDARGLSEGQTVIVDAH